MTLYCWGLESVQCRAAGWINSSYDPILQIRTKSSELCISELGWPLLISRRKYFSVLMVYSILKRAPIDFSKHFKFTNLLTHTHPLMLVLQTSSVINAFRYSFFVAAPFCGIQSHIGFYQSQAKISLNQNLDISYIINAKLCFCICVVVCMLYV